MCVFPGEAPTDLYSDRTARRQGTQTPLQTPTSAHRPGELSQPTGRRYKRGLRWMDFKGQSAPWWETVKLYHKYK